MILNSTHYCKKVQHFPFSIWVEKSKLGYIGFEKMVAMETSML